jgi:hypothetical protein
MGSSRLVSGYLNCRTSAPPGQHFRRKLQKISNAFKQSLASFNLAPEGYYAAWYGNDKEGVRCMVWLNH